MIIGAVLLIGIAIWLYLRWRKKKQEENDAASKEAAAKSMATSTRKDTYVADQVADRQPVLTTAVQERDRGAAIRIFQGGGGGGPIGKPRIFGGPGVFKGRFRRAA